MSIRRLLGPLPLGLTAVACLALATADCSGSDGARAPSTSPAPAAKPAIWSTAELVNNLADVSEATVYLRTIRIDDPGAPKQGLEAASGWMEYQHRLRRKNSTTMTPWAGLYEIAFTRVGKPVSEAVARGRLEVRPGARLIVTAAGLADGGEARVIVRDSRDGSASSGMSLLRVWNLLPGTSPVRIEVAAAEPPYDPCRLPTAGWVTVATDARFGDVSRPISLRPGIYHVRVGAPGRKVVSGFAEAPDPSFVQPREPILGEVFITGVTRSADVLPSILQAHYWSGVVSPSDCEREAALRRPAGS